MGPGSRPALAAWFQEHCLRGSQCLSLSLTVVVEQDTGLGMEIDFNWQSACTVPMKPWVRSQTLHKPGTGGTHL